MWSQWEKWHRQKRKRCLPSHHGGAERTAPHCLSDRMPSFQHHQWYGPWQHTWPRDKGLQTRQCCMELIAHQSSGHRAQVHFWYTRATNSCLYGRPYSDLGAIFWSQINPERAGKNVMDKYQFFISDIEIATISEKPVKSLEMTGTSDMGWLSRTPVKSWKDNWGMLSK